MDKLEQKKEDILDAAIRCLARYGMIKTTLDDIAGLLGLNKATLYYYYENKEHIFLDALEREAHRFIEHVKARFTDRLTAAEKLILLVRLYHEYIRDRAELLELNARAMVDNHAIMRSIHRRLRSRNVDFIAEVIQEGIDRGEFRAVDATRVADMIRYILDFRRLEFFLGIGEDIDKEPDYSELQDESLFILDVLLNGLKKAF